MNLLLELGGAFALHYKLLLDTGARCCVLRVMHTLPGPCVGCQDGSGTPMERYLTKYVRHRLRNRRHSYGADAGRATRGNT